MWFLIVVGLLTLLVYLRVVKLYKYWERKEIAYVKPWPFVGNLGPFFFRKRAMSHWLEDMYKKFPEQRYVGLYMMMEPVLLIRDPELIKQIAVKEADTFPHHRELASEDVDPLWGRNLFAMTGDRWHDMRSTLSPAFTSSKMRMMFGLMKECSKQFTDFSGVRGLVFFLYSISPRLMKALNIRIFGDKISSFFRGLVKETIRVREDKGIVRPDMLHLLMEARKGRLKDDDQGNTVDSNFSIVQNPQVAKFAKRQKFEITDDDVTAQALIFFFAGFDTSSTLMCFTCYELAVNVAVQEKLVEEVRVALKKCKGDITYEVLLEMKYLDMVIAETLRKWPPTEFTDRECIKNFTIEPKLPGEKPLHIDTKTSCWIPMYPIHRDPKYYPNPEKFDPERFSDENKKNVQPYTFLPFGTGPRSCIGFRFALLETKLVIFEILRKFEILGVEKTQIPLVLKKGDFNMLTEKGIWLGLKPRDPTL